MHAKNREYRFVKFYQRGVLKTFKVVDKNDARRALKRFNVPAGYYHVEDSFRNILENVKIYPF